MEATETGFMWDVELPDRTSYGLGGRRPRGRVIISTPERGQEVLMVPKAVARSLATRRKSGDLAPSSRAELLYRLRECSMAQAQMRVADLVNRRDYSRHELAEKLSQDGYLPNVVEEVVGRAVASGLVDDRRFADAFARTKVAAGWGMRRIADELHRRGIDVDELPGWPFEYLDPDDEASRARDVAQRHRVSGRNQFQKLVRFLVGRGFSTSVAYDAARRVLEESVDV